MSDVDKIKIPMTDAMRAAIGDGSIVFTSRTLSDWRSMDTAPKDGTRILIWDGGCEIVSWRSHNMSHSWWRTTNGTLFDPKFWMPLPKPPVTKT